MRNLIKLSFQSIDTVHLTKAVSGLQWVQQLLPLVLHRSHKRDQVRGCRAAMAVAKDMAVAAAILGVAAASDTTVIHTVAVVREVGNMDLNTQSPIQSVRQNHLQFLHL